MSSKVKQRRASHAVTRKLDTTATFPKELRKRQQWVVYRLEPDRDRPGRLTKVPYRNATQLASSSEPQHWLTYQDARALVKEASFDGVGFVFRAKDPYVAIDLDGCRHPDTGKVAKWARPILKQFSGSYTELSQSGAGFHIIAKAKLADDIKHRRDFAGTAGGKKAQLEVYDRLRYFVMTGQVYKQRRMITRQQNAVDALVTRYLKRSVAGTNVDLPVRNRHLHDPDVLERAAALNPSEFHRLFDAGETRPGKTESESDFQLALLFARVVGGNVEVIERLMRQSALVRDKWDEHPSYLGQLTIARAVAVVAHESPPTQDHDTGAQRRYYPSLAALEDYPELLVRPAPLARYIAWPGRVTLLAGREKKGGKSTFLSAAVAAVTRGKHFLDLPTCKKPGKVLWISADQEHESDIYNRLKEFEAKMRRVALIYPLAQTLPERLAELDTHIELDKPTWVIIDTLSNFARVKDPFASTEWPEAILHVKRACRERTIAATIAHHTAKNSNEYRDSTSIGATVDQITYILEANQKHYTRQDRRMETLGRASGYEEGYVTLDGQCYRVTVNAALALGDRIQAHLAENPGASQRAIEQALGGDRLRVRDTLKHLVKEGHVTQGKGAHGAHSYTLGDGPAEETE